MNYAGDLWGKVVQRGLLIVGKGFCTIVLVVERKFLNSETKTGERPH